MEREVACPQCSAPNPAAMRFCGACASPLKRRCAHCRAENPAGHRFCGQCASPLDNGSTATSKSNPPPARSASTLQSAEAEWRQLTVVFCDLVNSVGLSQRLDAEELRELLLAYQAAVGDAMKQQGGHIAQFLGDGILVYFGYPSAREDDAARAVRAALRAVQAVKRLDVPSAAAAIEVRIGIHTGSGVMGDVGTAGSQERLVIGSTPNIAARLQALAAPNQVLISADTHRIVEGLFHVDALGEVPLKGLDHPIQVASVLAESGLRSRMEVEARKALRPMVGRQTQLTVLMERLARAKRGGGATVLVSGDPGLGKSRLLHDFCSGLSEEVVPLRGRCAPDSENSPLLPLVEIYRELFGLKGDADDLGRLQQRLSNRALSDSAACALIAGFLSVDAPADEAVAQLSPAKRRMRTLTVLIESLVAEAAAAPTLLLIEDLHWVDPSTLEFIATLMDEGANHRLLLLLTARPEFTAPWGFRPYFSELRLERLADDGALQILRAVAGGKKLPASIEKQILSRADGVPLYLEEMTRAVIESDVVREGSDGFELNLPSTLRDSLASRLDRLGPAKEIAQLAAVIGRQFSFQLLAAISTLQGHQLRRHLDELRKADLISVDASAQHESYLFRHALIQDAAYDSLLRKTRQHHHAQIAQALESTVADEAAERPELLAWHYERAGRAVPAADRWLEAGQKAQARAANHEAVAHLNRALRLLGELPDTLERSQKLLAVQGARGAAYMATRGWSAPEVQSSYEAARALCERMGNPEQLFPVLWGNWAYQLVSGHFDPALELAEKLHEMAHKSRDVLLIPPAHHALGYAVYFQRCDYQRALAIAEEGIALFDLERERKLVATYQQSCTATLLDIAASSLWCLGFPEQALAKGYRAPALAKQLDHAPALAFATASIVWGVAGLRRDNERICAAADETIELASKEDFSFWPPLVSIFRGWAELKQGSRAGVDKMRASIDAYTGAGAGVLATTGFALLMEGLLELERIEEGIALAEEARRHIARSREHHFECEVDRVEGELRGVQARARGSDAELAEALALVERASAFARDRQARSLELRAAMTRVRISPAAKRPDAVAELRAVYNWFSEGFDTADLREAKALLEPARPATAAQPSRQP